MGCVHIAWENFHKDAQNFQTLLGLSVFLKFIWSKKNSIFFCWAANNMFCAFYLVFLQTFSFQQIALGSLGESMGNSGLCVHKTNAHAIRKVAPTLYLWRQSNILLQGELMNTKKTWMKCAECGLGNAREIRRPDWERVRFFR